MPKKKKFDRIKQIKRDSRLTTKVTGRGGPHSDKRERRQQKMSTLDYLLELEGEEMDDVKIGTADIVTAFDSMAVGSKVTNAALFMELLLDAVESFDWETCRTRGQAYIELPDEAKHCVLAGVGQRTNNPDDYVIRTHRGRVGMYLRRHLAPEVTGVAVVVYTSHAYRDDPQIEWEEIERISKHNYSHMLVAVLAHSEGSNSPLTPHRFIENLAGGNNEALSWTADEIREKAREISNHSNAWTVVAD